MVNSDVDEAFEWFVLIIGIVSGIMSQFPELFWSGHPVDVPPSLKAAKGVVIPLLLTLMMWLIGKLSAKRFQPIAKIIAWVYVSSLTFAYCFQFFMAIEWLPTSSMMTGLGMVFFWLGPVLVLKFIVPKYRESYPDSTFLRSKIKLLIALIIAGLIFGLMSVAITGF